MDNVLITLPVARSEPNLSKVRLPNFAVRHGPQWRVDTTAEGPMASTGTGVFRFGGAASRTCAPLVQSPV